MMRSFVLAAVVAAGCGSAAKTHGDTLRSRASFDMRCPAPQLTITDIDLQTAGVEGCGQRGTYIFNGTWVLNSPGADPAPLDGASPSESLPGVRPGSPPGTLPGSMSGTPPGSPPGTPPGPPHR